MLITDYSSVCWDVCYLDKPVLFYQFDYDMYMQAHGSYLDMEHELFGERYTEYEKLIDGIEEYIHNGFKEKEEYILPVKFDKTEIPGIRDTIGYLDANKFNPDELVDIFMKKFFNE